MSARFTNCFGQGTLGNGLGLRPEGSNLAARSPKRAGCSYQEKYPLPSTTDRLIVMRIRASLGGRTLRLRSGQAASVTTQSVHTNAFCWGNERQRQWSILSRRNRGLRHPAYFYFVSFALRAPRN